MQPWSRATHERVTIKSKGLAGFRIDMGQPTRLWTEASAAVARPRIARWAVYDRHAVSAHTAQNAITVIPKQRTAMPGSDQGVT